MSTLDQLQRMFRLADAFDVAVIAVFLYAVLVWIKSTASRQIVIGMAFLTAIYLAARAFDMYMTATLFQACLAFAAVAAIVVFQEDLRRAFVNVASFGRFLRRRTQENASFGFDVLVETAFELTQKKVGALVVVRGTEPLDRHLRGGVDIDARISKPLLDSLFDPHSMGHDGAVIVERDRIRQFAVHLPLSHNFKQVGSRGTRHSAALGLSEVSDALVVVVSEERREVSVAEGGKLERVDSPTELRRQLERFVRRLRPPKSKGLRGRFLVENPGMKFTSVIVACIIWFVVSFESETIYKTFVVPIEYRNLPEMMDIDDNAPDEARVTLSGFERAMNLLAPSTLKVSLDLSKIEEGQQQIVLEDSHIRIPSNVSLFRTSPRVVSLRVHQWVRGHARIATDIEGSLSHPLRLREISVVPATARVLIWNSFQSPSMTVYTEPIDLRRITASVDLTVKLVLPRYVRLQAESPPEVQVRVNVETDDAGTNTTRPARPEV